MNSFSIWYSYCICLKFWDFVKSFRSKFIEKIRYIDLINLNEKLLDRTQNISKFNAISLRVCYLKPPIKRNVWIERIAKLPVIWNRKNLDLFQKTEILLNQIVGQILFINGMMKKIRWNFFINKNLLENGSKFISYEIQFHCQNINQNLHFSEENVTLMLPFIV